MITYTRKQQYNTTKTSKTNTLRPGHVQKYYKHEFILPCMLKTKLGMKTEKTQVAPNINIRTSILMIFHINHYQIGTKNLDRSLLYYD
jgi:hypothetical protein